VRAKALARRFGPWGGLAGLAAALVLLERGLSDYELRLVNVLAINVLLATSLNLTNGYVGVFSLGHAGFAAVGAYVSALLTLPAARKAMMLPDLPTALASAEWPFAPALLAAGAAAAVCALAVGYPVLRLRGHYLAVATLGFMVIVQTVAASLTSVTRGAQGINGIPAETTVWWTYGAAVACVYLVWAVDRSTFGRAMRALREDDLAAQACGVRFLPIRLGAFAAGAFFAGAAGALWAHLITVITPSSFSFALTFQVVLMVIVGGPGTVAGGVAGAVAMTLVPEALRLLEGGFSLGGLAVPPLFGASQIALSVLLILFVIFRPSGLFGAGAVIGRHA
jgi:branched-chain amino acid transport system permease protein